MDGLALKHSFPALDFWVGEGEEQALFDAYFKACEMSPPTAPPAFGWTSWYNHFTNISEAVLLGNLESFCATQPISAKNLDDGTFECRTEVRPTLLPN
ncbi:MAG: hypothetical protein IPH31_26730 [Lewinellaceae bacterium]|nr:hypothetical protein [Lewinellaceae bacterium]